MKNAVQIMCLRALPNVCALAACKQKKDYRICGELWKNRLKMEEAKK